MPLAQLIHSVRGVFNEGTAPFAAAIAAWFTANPSIIVQSVNWNRPDSTFTGDDQVLRIAYLQATAPAIGGTWQALFYQSNASATAQDQFNSAFAVSAAPALIPMFIVDITDHERARTGQNALVVICLRTDVGPLGEVGYDRAAFIAQPLASIASGATGNAVILDGAGAIVSSSMAVKNVGAVSWPQDERNYVVYDEESGTYIGIPSCAGGTAWSPPAATTTTAFPCPHYFPEPNPTTTFTVTTFTTTTTTETTTTDTTTSTTTTTTTTTTTSTTTDTTITTAPPLGCQCFQVCPLSIDFVIFTDTGGGPVITDDTCTWTLANGGVDDSFATLIFDRFTETYSIVINMITESFSGEYLATGVEAFCIPENNSFAIGAVTANLVDCSSGSCPPSMEIAAANCLGGPSPECSSTGALVIDGIGTIPNAGGYNWDDGFGCIAVLIFGGGGDAYMALNELPGFPGTSYEAISPYSPFPPPDRGPFAPMACVDDTLSTKGKMLMALTAGVGPTTITVSF